MHYRAGFWKNLREGSLLVNLREAVAAGEMLASQQLSAKLNWKNLGI